MHYFIECVTKNTHHSVQLSKPFSIVAVVLDNRFVQKYLRILSLPLSNYFLMYGSKMSIKKRNENIDSNRFRVLVSIVALFGILPIKANNVVVTAQGKLRGVPHDGFVSYTGIPYATAGENSERFKVCKLGFIIIKAHTGSSYNETIIIDIKYTLITPIFFF